MAKQTWVQCPVTHKLILKDQYVRPADPKSAMVVKGFDAFKSPVDGSVISCNSKLRDHNKRHGVTNVQDYGQAYFDKRGREKNREMLGQTRQAKQERVNTIKSAMYKHNMHR